MDETVNHLELAYQNRDKLGSYDTRAGDDMKTHTWKKNLEEFVKILEGGGNPGKGVTETLLHDGIWQSTSWASFAVILWFVS
ncbi:MAG: hypothetical protein ACUZ9M_10480 [Candidatus Scalindua sp.]